MTLPPATRLGAYEIERPIGAGGMGEVYLARDLRLDRRVAVKVLPVEVASDPARRLRFEREARAISSLTHPHICALYDVGEQDGLMYLVLEYVEGETLARRLSRGALPLEEGLRFAIQIADALDQAHRQGIVHRDLKPANVMLTRSGAKLLDFGLARLRAPEYSLSVRSASDTEPLGTLTEEGTILGTVQYMSPEQLEGQDVDARTDLFALGAILFEMATGRQAFGGKSKPSVMAAILERTPPRISAERGGRLTPALLDDVVQRCLAKDPNDRWQTAADLREVLSWIAQRPADSAIGAAVPATSRDRVTLSIAGVACGVAALSIAIATVLYYRPGPEPLPYRFSLAPPANGSFHQSSAFMAVSPNGRHLVFVASAPEANGALWLHSFDTSDTRLLPGTESAARPFWSPDSRFVAFGAGGKLKKVDVLGGLPRDLGDASAVQSGAWNREGTIVLRPDQTGGHLVRIPDEGGSASVVTALDAARGETRHDWPQFLPDGRHFLFVASSSQAEHDGILYVGSLDSPQTRTAVLRTDSQAVYVRDGRLLFMRGNSLLAQSFDTRAFRVAGDPVQVAPYVERTAGSRRGAFSASDTGVLAYRGIRDTQLAWFDRQGQPLGTLGPRAVLSSPALSPDEQRIAVDRLDPAAGTHDIWMIETAGGRATAFTSEPTAEQMPLWSPDGRDITFRGSGGIYRKAAAGSGGSELLVPLAAVTAGEPRRAWAAPFGWTADGRTLLYGAATVGRTEFDLWIWSTGVPPTAFIATAHNETQAKLSPDKRWVAYVSDETRKTEVYVRSFPSGEARWLVSSAGGLDPYWSPDGTELFYLALDRSLMAVAVKTAPAFEAGAPRRLFATEMSPLVFASYTRNQYLVASGGRFLLNQPVGEPASLTVVINWPAALKP